MLQKLLMNSERDFNMKQYTVVITESALADMEDIYKHIAYVLLSPNNARGQYNRIADKILSLEYMPERSCCLDTEVEGLRDLRQLPVDNYRVFYIIRQDKVIVTNVLYAASDIESRLQG